MYRKNEDTFIDCRLHFRFGQKILGTFLQNTVDYRAFLDVPKILVKLKFFPVT